MKLSFKTSLIISLGIIFLTNLFYIFMIESSTCFANESICAGVVSLIVSNFFIGLYLLFFTLLSIKFLSNFKKHYIMIVFNATLSLLFYLFYGTVQFLFQNDRLLFDLLHIGHVPLIPYLFLLILGIATYFPLALFISKTKKS